MKEYPITVSMTPSFFDENHMLLRTQLKCLAEQTVKDFDVYLIDVHYQKRKNIIPELALKFNLDIKHIPYTPNVRYAKIYDCSIFNAGYLFSKAKINVRYSCYRFARPTFIEKIVQTPQNVNVDFYFKCLGPCANEIKNKLIPEKHKKIWNFKNEDINWNLIPDKKEINNIQNEIKSLYNWDENSEIDTKIIDIPLNLYGNIAWNRDQWLFLNGTNEVITNACHWEDIDFDMRANLAGQKVIRYAHQLYRLFHDYGNFAQRSNIEVDIPYKKPCHQCIDVVKHNSGDEEYEFKLFKRIKNNDYDLFYNDHIWVCKNCNLSGPVYTKEKGIDFYISYIRENKLIQSPILDKYLIGRNLKILSEKMDREKSLKNKIEIFNESWSNIYFYQI